MSKVKGDLDEVKSVMVQNIEKVLERGEKIDRLVVKTEDLDNQAVRFKKSSTVLKRAMWWRNAKLMAILGTVFVLLLFIIVASSCGGISFPNCR